MNNINTMNYKEKIEEIIKKYAKPLGVGLAPDSAWLRDMKFLAEEFADLYEQAQRDAVEGFEQMLFYTFMDCPSDEVYTKKDIKMILSLTLNEYLNQTKEDK